MRCESYQQFATIRSDSEEDFDRKLNEKMRQLRNNKPEVEFRDRGQILVAHIRYTEREYQPDDLGDEYEQQNIRFTCQDCPMFEPILNKDGSPNLKVKYGDCKYAQFGRTFKESRCCDTLYKLFRTGEVQLCLAKSE